MSSRRCNAPPNRPVRHRREPEKGVLHRVLRESLETFLAQAEERGSPLPRFVQRELRGYLACGILAHGFARVHCFECGKDELVAFSCKGRGFCPSCGGRRMADTAAHLVERVLPEVPVRQWVLSFPYSIRFSLNPHFHALVLDGVYASETPLSPPHFHPALPLEDEHVEKLTHVLRRRVLRHLERKGLLPRASDEERDAEPAELEDAQPSLFEELCAASITGHGAGRLGAPVDPRSGEKAFLASQLCCAVDGFSHHAKVEVEAHDRERLERLCRYVARPPIATQRLCLDERERVLYGLRRHWKDGTQAVVFEPLTFLARLAALVPPPRAHQMTYHGVLAPAAEWRELIVPNASSAGGAPSAFTSRYTSWAELSKRVFAIDALVCPHCGGKRKLIALIQDALVARKILEPLGLDAQPPRPAPARSPPKLAFAW